MIVKVNVPGSVLVTRIVIVTSNVTLSATMIVTVIVYNSDCDCDCACNYVTALPDNSL